MFDLERQIALTHRVHYLEGERLLTIPCQQAVLTALIRKYQNNRLALLYFRFQAMILEARLARIQWLSERAKMDLDAVSKRNLWEKRHG